MQSFKRENFEAAHPGKLFPRVDPLPDEETTLLRSRIAERLGCAEDDGLSLVRSLAARSLLVERVDAEGDEFDLRRTLWSLRITSEPSVYLNWNRFESIDRMEVDDLARHFSDVWYPSSDDLDVFDSTCDWVLSVGHSGDVRCARLGLRRVVGS